MMCLNKSEQISMIILKTFVVVAIFYGYYKMFKVLGLDGYEITFVAMVTLFILPFLAACFK